mgnify:FL=1
MELRDGNYELFKGLYIIKIFFRSKPSIIVNILFAMQGASNRNIQP